MLSEHVLASAERGEIESQRKVLEALSQGHTVRLSLDPLLYCAFRGLVNTCGMLIQNGAKPILGNSSPLHFAAFSGHAHLCADLLKSGIPVDIQCPKGRTALHYCANGGDLTTCVVLLRAKAPVHLTDCDGATPLHMAASRGRKEVCQALLKARANPFAGLMLGMSPLIVASRGRHRDVCELLARAEETGPDIPSSLHRSAAAGHYAAAAALLRDVGVDPNLRDSKGKTPMHYAAKHNHSDILRLLVLRGGNINAKCNKHRTPIRDAPNVSLVSVAQLVALGARTSKPFVRSLEDTIKARMLRPRSTLAKILLAVTSSNGDADKCLQMLRSCSRARQETAALDIIMARRERCKRLQCVLNHRRAVEARMNAKLLLLAAAQGRPLELAKRLRLGVLAGGMRLRCEVDDGIGGRRLASALEAARLGEHDECVKLLLPHSV